MFGGFGMGAGGWVLMTVFWIVLVGGRRVGDREARSQPDRRCPGAAALGGRAA